MKEMTRRLGMLSVGMLSEDGHITLFTRNSCLLGPSQLFVRVS